MSGHSGHMSREPFAYFNPDSSCWRMSQPSLPLENLPELSVIFPRSGMTRNGCAYELPTSVLPMAEPESSSLLPTPNHRDYKGSPSAAWEEQASLPRAVELLPTPGVAGGGKKIPEDATWSGKAAYKTDGTKVQVHLDRIEMLLPTPTATPYGNNQSASSGAAVRPSLDSLAPLLLPTPRATRGGSHTETVALLPTPTAADSERTSVTYERGNPTLLGAVTNPPLDDGNTFSDG